VAVASAASVAGRSMLPGRRAELIS